MSTKYLSIILILLAVASAMSVELQVGDMAPAFQAKNDAGIVWQSSSVVGKEILVVYFYPAAMTGGCTKQACAFRDDRTELTDLGAEVVGVSGDAVEGLSAFKNAHNLNFTLLADQDGSIAKAFGVPTREGGSIERTIDGREIALSRGVTASRWTFIIDKSGKIAYKNTQVNAENDSKDVMSIIAAMTQSARAANTLTAAETKAGWTLLWDGKTKNGWRGAYKERFPESGWLIKDGELIVEESGGAESRNGGDIITAAQYGDFELSLEFKLTAGANSGIKYFVTERTPKPAGSAIGLEYQVLDDAGHPDAKAGVGGNRTVGSLYDLIPAENKRVNPIGQWNQVRLVCKGNRVEHWLNGRKVVDYERGTQIFRALVQKSKYAQYDGFGLNEQGHILLQDHGNTVHYRNIKIRDLSAT
jgi:peroxiredoxin